MSTHSPATATPATATPASARPTPAPATPAPAFPATAAVPDQANDGDLGPLRSLELFAGLPVAEVEEFAAHSTVSTAHPGQVVQAQDVPVRMWHVITAGHAIVQRDGTPIGLLGRGDSWAEHSLLNQLRSPIAVVALSPLTLRTVNMRAFFEIPDHHPVLAGRLVARAATSPDRLALPVFNALVHLADTKCTGGVPRAGTIEPFP